RPCWQRLATFLGSRPVRFPDAVAAFLRANAIDPEQPSPGSADHDGCIALRKPNAAHECFHRGLAHGPVSITRVGEDQLDEWPERQLTETIARQIQKRLTRFLQWVFGGDR